MKTNFLFALLLSLILTFDITVAQAGENEMPPEMKVWMEYMTPSDVHQLMAAYTGEWKAEIKMWQHPGAEPVVSEGTTSMEMILGGRYLKSFHKAEFMGMEMNGISFESYDNGKKEFTSVWIDNFGTGMMIGKGKWDEKTKSINYAGVMYDPMIGEDVGFREVIYYIDEDHQKMEMFMANPEGEFQSMEILFTRIK